MAEDKSEVPNPGRRNAFKIGAVALGAALLGREVKTFKQGFIDTPVGEFYPLYEFHSAGLKEQEVPEGLDAFFREYIEEGLYEKSPSEILNKKIAVEGPDIVRKEGTIHILDFPVLKKLARNNTKVVFGDTFPAREGVTADISKALRSGRGWAGGIVIATGAAYALYKTVLHKLHSTQPTQQEITRRQFIAKSALTAGLLLDTPLISMILGGSTVVANDRFNQNSAIQRVIQRLGAVAESLSPEDHIIFFRNLVMSDKMLTVAEDMQQLTDKKPKVAFNVGASHSNIEDFLCSGHDFTRFLLSLYPRDFIQGVAEFNNGIENFCSARVFTLNPDVTREDVEGGNNEQVIIQEERIVDQQLLNNLKAKLAT